MKHLIYALAFILPLTFAQNGLSQCGAPPTINFNQNTFFICPGQSIDLIATPNGTVGNVSLQWTPGGVADTNSTYTVSPTAPLTWYYLELTDDCFTVIDSVNVENHPVVLNSITTTDAVNCPGQTSVLGQINVLPDDPAWTYTVTGGGNTLGPQNNGFFDNLTGNITYFLTVMNQDGCTLDTAIYIGLALNSTTANFVLDSLHGASCFGNADGSAYINNIGSGITAPYDITWTHTSGLHFSETVPAGGSSYQDDLYGGQWVVTVMDQEGCAWSYLFAILQPNELLMNLPHNDPTCYQLSDGSVTIVPTGGTPTYTFAIWDSLGSALNPGNSSTANLLPEGWYYGSVTDANGCSVNDSVFLDDPGEIQIGLITGDLFCYGDSSYTVVDTVINYTGSYNQLSYLWTPDPAGISGIGADSLYDMTAGNYTLIIIDQNGCTSTATFSLTSPPALNFAQLSSTPCTNGQDGSVSAAASGGTPGYSYEWMNLTDSTTTNNTSWGGLSPGNYQITVTDGNGCLLIDTVAVGCLGFEENDFFNTISLFPNPSNGLLNVLFDTEIINVNFAIYDLQGRVVYQLNRLSGQSFKLNLEILEKGVYFLNVIHENQLETIRFVID